MFFTLKHPVTEDTSKFGKSIHQKDIDEALQYKAGPTDVFICSYAKTGTTWLQNIAWLILHHGRDMQGCLRDNIPMLEFDGSNFTNQIDNTEYPRLIKTHFKQSWVPFHLKAKYLYITRNPKDAMVSMYFHYKGFPQYLDAIDFDKLFDMFAQGETNINGYFDHVTEWYKKRNESNVLFLLYENLKQDAEGQILGIARFLGEEYYEALLKEGRKLLKVIVEKSSFKHMKNNSNVKWTSAERPADLPFIRQGQVGDWRNHLSSEQSKIMEEMIKEKGATSGWSSLWDNHGDVWDEKIPN